MSRSTRAWKGTRAAITVVGCGGGERAGFEDRAYPGRRRLPRAVSSTKYLGELLAACVLALAATPPALALAASHRAAHPHAASHGHDGQRSSRAARGVGVVLALGSGYSGRGGWAPGAGLQ